PALRPAAEFGEGSSAPNRIRLRWGSAPAGRSILAAAGGGAEGDRTPDLLIANEALSQLSYGPRGQRDFARCAGLRLRHLGPALYAVNKPAVRFNGRLFAPLKPATSGAVRKRA